MYIYKIHNHKTGNFYFGQRSANKLPPELDTAYWGSSRLLNGIRKERPENWLKEIVSCHTTKEELAEAEQAVIDEYWGHPLLLNRCIPGTHVYSRTTKGKKKPPRTEEHRANISAAMKGKKKPTRTEEHRANMSAARKGKKHSDESKAKMSASWATRRAR
ncbi:NUMOD3 domain-containing DNA-binding protein [Roseateles albus]|uniref:NUMOD3 domain-containing DNA-binding protein n=1 Tax=Roseateles albus TaxID=2987525 RepID=A0ABT5KJF0_9BURK|nr:NUMOD3 domain-containing DNA-binding protein [Roseateles albus]MDC8773564.1 NUMOD3 domain-containing DNA-binding protein [Roseateles albus]